jgi:uncharacterized protein YgiM (DUF1202 family)
MKRFALLIVAVLCLGAVIYAQDIEPLTPPTGTEAIAITFPVPVYSVSGEVTIAGSANVQGMSNYFIEFRPLKPTVPSVDGSTPTPSQEPWFPATLPNSNSVSNNILGIWNTTTAPDGLYELRLVVNVGGQSPQYFRVSPVRVVNDPAALSPFAPNDARPPLLATPTQVGVFPSGAEATQIALATLFAGQNNVTPSAGATLAPSTSPIVIAQIDANVRSGDSTAYPTVGSLLTGQSATIIGISTTGSGWYYIQLPTGRRGFVSPSVVRVEGNINGVQSINPPPVPATATPVPTATPAFSPDLLPSGVRLEPLTPQCNQAFNVFINVTNNGATTSNQAVDVQVTNKHTRTGQIIQTSNGSAPVLAIGQNWVVVVPMNISAYIGEEHEIIVTVDPANLIPDTNRGNNSTSIKYTLGAGGC